MSCVSDLVVVANPASLLDARMNEFPSGLTCAGGDGGYIGEKLGTVMAAPQGASCCFQLGHRCSSAR